MSSDVIELILTDHRRFEDLFRGLRDRTSDRAALLLEVSSGASAGSGEWEDKLEELVETISHHLDEEERTILNDARDAVPGSRRIELGDAFSAVRDEQLGSGCGEIDNVRRLVKETEGRID